MTLQPLSNRPHSIQGLVAYFPRLRAFKELGMHVLITGASSGLGQAIALEYARLGHDLSLCGRNADRLEATANKCRDHGADVHCTILDVTDPDAMQKWAMERDAAVPVDYVFANAGVGGADVLTTEMGEAPEHVSRIIEVNTLATINLVAPLARKMAGRSGGHIVLIGSISGQIGMPQSPIYCASKAALHVYGDGLRRLLRKSGVSVTVVVPGFIDTPMSRSLNLARPFCWTAERAATHIARDVKKRAAYSIFPWQLRFAVAFHNMLPRAIADLVWYRI
jgi:short-subunit dehydrogenase